MKSAPHSGFSVIRRISARRSEAIFRRPPRDGLVDPSEEIDPLIDHFERFIHAGLEAVALQLRSERGRLERGPPGALAHQIVLMTPTGAFGRLGFQGQHGRDRRHRDEA